VDLEKRQVNTLIARQKGEVCLINDRECEVLPLWEPNDLVLKNIHLYIADTNNHLIRLFSLESRELSDVAVV
jgi:hypothetical protein